MGSMTADLMDASKGAYQSCETQFRQFGAHTRFEGPIRTVTCDNDTVLLKRLLAEPGEGQVLIVDGGASMHSALLGDLTATKAAELGWAGIVVYGAVRDVEALAAVTIGIKALGTSPRKPRQEGTGTVDADVTFGGVTFRPGRTVWSDADGLITLPLP